MQRRQREALTAALEAVVADDRTTAVRLLCRILQRRDVPIIPRASPVHRAVGAPVRSACVSTGTPKPAPRIVDEALLARFRRAHPYCALAGCYASAVPHHIVKRSQGGGDVWDNLVALCVRHHTGDEGWHNGLKFPTPQAWLVVYGDQLPDAVYANIARALGVEAA